MELSGRRVLVTGASKGIGEHTARAFAAKGAKVAVAARTTDAVERLATELGGRAYTVDLADPAQVDGFFDRVEQDGAVDVLVNNAGIEAFIQIEEMEPEMIDHLLSLNLATPLKLTGQAVSRMLGRRSGHIVQVSSLAAISPSPGGALYCASKAGLSHATACIELELRGTGVNFTTVHLGFIETDMGERAMSADTMRPFIKRFAPLGITKLTSPEKVATAVVRAVEKDKRFVLYPKSASVMAGLSNSPRRMVHAMSRGITYH